MNKSVALAEMSPLINEILLSDGEIVFTVTGNSMAPMLRHRRDKVCLIKAPDQPLHKYDLPLFVRPNGKYVLHRIIGVFDDGYMVIGDNQLTREYPVLHSQVIGIVKAFWRNDKYISCNNPWYRAYCRLWTLLFPLRWFYLIFNALLFRVNRRWHRLTHEG